MDFRELHHYLYEVNREFSSSRIGELKNPKFVGKGTHAFVISAVMSNDEGEEVEVAIKFVGVYYSLYEKDFNDEIANSELADESGFGPRILTSSILTDVPVYEKLPSSYQCAKKRMRKCVDIGVIIMEYIPTTLASCLHNTKDYDQKRIDNIEIKLIQCIKKCANANMVCLDITPNNVLVTRDDDCKIIDYDPGWVIHIPDASTEIKEWFMLMIVFISCNKFYRCNLGWQRLAEIVTTMPKTNALDLSRKYDKFWYICMHYMFCKHQHNDGLFYNRFAFSNLYKKMSKHASNAWSPKSNFVRSVCDFSKQDNDNVHCLSWMTIHGDDNLRHKDLPYVTPFEYLRNLKQTCSPKNPLKSQTPQTATKSIEDVLVCNEDI